MDTRVASLPRRRTRIWLGVAAAAAALLAVRGVGTWIDWRDTTPTKTSPAPALPIRTVSAGAVTVKVEPRAVNTAGAVFKVSFDSHSEALDLDVARGATLVVGDVAWPVGGWSGPGPGGHHREGELRFSPAGPAKGTATLTITGLSKPVTAAWDIGS